jgi:hypothetical protein
MFLHAEIETIGDAAKVFGPMGGVCAALVFALIFMFRKYEAEKTATMAEKDARIQDAKASAKMLEELAPYVAKLARRINRVSSTGRDRDDDSDPPPPTSRARIHEEDD